MTKAEAAEPDAPTLALRIALHMGAVTATEHDIYGQGVNVAARLPRPPDVSPLPSLAVLPLRNLGGDPQDDYFADGVVDDIVVSLGNLRELMVVSRSSTLAWRGQEGDLRAVSRALGVRYLVTGSVRRAAGSSSPCRTASWSASSPASRRMSAPPSCGARCASGPRASPPTT